MMCDAKRDNRSTMDKEKSMDVDLTVVSSSEGGEVEPSENKTPRKRNLDACEASLSLSEKKSHLDQESMVVVQLPPVEEGAGDHSPDHKMENGKGDGKGAVHQSATEYFEFIKGPGGDDFAPTTSQMMEKGSKSPTAAQSTSSESNGGDRDCVSSSQQQQYYIAVDARTVATLQAGAEYTLVPVDQGGKPVAANASEERSQAGFEEERMWVAGDAQLKNTDHPQQLLMQTMRPLPSTPGSPLPQCAADENANGHPTSSDSFSSSAMFTGNADCNSSPHGKSSGSSSGAPVVQTPTVLRGCPPMAVKFEGPPRFSTPTSTHNGYPLMATPHPHLLYNMPTTPHHPGSSGAYTYSGHRLHLPAASPAWHTSPFSQNFSPHSGQSFLNSQSNASASNLSLNSSGEENENVSPEYPRVPHNTPNTDGALFPITAIPRAPNMSQILGPLDNMQYFPIPYTGRENHNEKERKRRSRIKNACSLLRDLVPGLSEKTDKATVFEYTVQYLLHLKRHVGKQFDKSWELGLQEFMEKYTPY